MNVFARRVTVCRSSILVAHPNAKKERSGFAAAGCRAERVSRTNCVNSLLQGSVQRGRGEGLCAGVRVFRWFRCIGCGRKIACDDRVGVRPSNDAAAIEQYDLVG